MLHTGSSRERRPLSLGPAEIMVILVIALLVFGPTRLPEVGRQVGRTMREFRRFQQTMRRDLHDVFGEDASDAAEPPPMLPPKGDVPGSDPGTADDADAVQVVEPPSQANPETSKHSDDVPPKVDPGSTR